MSVSDTIKRKLTDALSPDELEVIDESHMHAGHEGARPEGETHFRVRVAAATFAGQSRLERQRKVYQILASELAGGVHALALATVTPEEVARGLKNEKKKQR